ncbi:MAG: c-type cytochrome biogenesis protein CcmI [Rhizobiales bacterium]|nr:c-type cytochrome biogenesis protein CcmI [Hyphomicrobiales bacterium]
MTLWFVFALMTAAAVFAVLWPLGRRAGASGGSEIAVYRDQLAEVDRDRDTGRIGAAEAEAARIEVSRRLLAAADAERNAGAAAAAKPSERPRRIVAVAALVLLPLGAAALYLAHGSPSRPGQPLSARLDKPPEQRSIETLVAQVEAHLDKNPNDGRGWEILAPVYMRLGRFGDAVKARSNALTFNGESAERYSGLGEALVAAAQGIVTAEAARTFERAVALDAQAPKPRFFLGLAAEQDGTPGEAAKRWGELIAEAPADAPWLGVVREALARVDPSVSARRGPSAADVAAAAELSPEQRQEMVRGMVARLAVRLKDDGSDLDGWLRLMRAYMILGERDKARSAAAAARRALAGDVDKLRRIDDAAKGLGLDG